MIFFQSHFSTCEISLVAGMWNIFLCTFYFCFWNEKFSISFHLRSLIQSLILPLLFLLFHSLHWKFKSSQDGTLFFSSVLFQSVFLDKHKPQIFDNRHAWSSFVFFLQFSSCSLTNTSPQFHNNPRKWVTPVSFKSTSESTGVMRAREGFIPEEYKYCLQLFYWGEF